MNPAVIFDLDQTIANTKQLAQLRKQRNWTQIYNEIPNLKTYETIDELINLLVKKSIKIIVITMSPSTYCTKIIDHFGWKIDGKICYHDVHPNLKPHPEAFLKAIRDNDLDPNATISAGDNAIDIIASNKANIPSIACSWDSDDSTSLLAASPTFHAKTPNELFLRVCDFHNLKL